MSTTTVIRKFTKYPDYKMVRTAKQRSSCVKLKKATLRCTTICLNQPEKLRKWSNESMLSDLKVVKEGRMGVNRAALSYGVPRTTLKDRVTGRVLHGSNFSPQPYLTTEEEKQLVDFLITSSKMGYGKTRRQVLKIVEAAVWFASVSHGWWICFTEHWPNLSLCKGDRTWSWC